MLLAVMAWMMMMRRRSEVLVVQLMLWSESEPWWSNTTRKSREWQIWHAYSGRLPECIQSKGERKREKRGKERKTKEGHIQARNVDNVVMLFKSSPYSSYPPSLCWNDGAPCCRNRMWRNVERPLHSQTGCRKGQRRKSQKVIIIHIRCLYSQLTLVDVSIESPSPFLCKMSKSEQQQGSSQHSYTLLWKDIPS